jgi:hypothetical protein
VTQQILGWMETAVFVGSYFFKRPAALRAMQMAGSVLWIIYGILIEATPVIAANVLVFTAAAWTFFGRSAAPAATPRPTPDTAPG